MTPEEIVEARQFVNRYGPVNSWTATYGTAARLIGRLLKDRERLAREIDNLKARLESATAEYYDL